ncbi:MAG TPA: fused MFS/spermidine synthase [Terriglobia bacterium]|nr:fused MFS/spermidine synthase [Terriglobia bacterium]
MSLNNSHQPSYSSPNLKILPLLFFASGGSSLIFETIFTRLLTYTFGNTAHAVSTVLAAFLGGLALGAYLIGRWVDRRPPSLWIYGLLELLVGVYCLFIPQLFALITRAYVGLYHFFELGPAALTAVRFGLAAVVILIPTVMMGGTLPALARFVTAGQRDAPWRISRLYAWNTLGAALGALTSIYLLMPSWGVGGTIWFAVGINTLVFAAVAFLARRSSADGSPGSEAASPEASSSEGPPSKTRAAVLLAGAFFTGLVALAYEVIWTHVLAFLIGNTVYAFGVMLFTFLCGLGLGAQIVARRFQRPAMWGRALAVSQVLLALAIFCTLPLWTRIPDLFAQGLQKAFEFDLLSVAFLLLLRMVYLGWKIYRRAPQAAFPWGRAIELGAEALLLTGLMGVDTAFVWNYEITYFLSGEMLRFFCAFYLLILPALLLGLSFPLLLHLASHRAAEVGARVGGVYAANTVGAILGSVLTGFVVLPHLGSLSTLRAAATVNLALGLGFALVLVRLDLFRRLLLGGIVASLVLLFWAGQGGWDARRMSRGSYVYFDSGWPIDRILYLQEDVEGGLTSVIQVGDTRVMLSNGKFQGNNSGEVGAQIRFALIPILFTQEFERALVIGLGTGNTLRTVTQFPFEHIDAVEIAPRIVEAARLWFGDVNDLVFDRDPRVNLSVADGRNFLLLSPQRYDLITIEISSIWISGEADLYNKEFYELCRKRLKERGVLQQWVQIHHMRTEDFLVILNTAASVFPHVAFFLGPEQGVLVASASPLECDYRRISAFDSDPRVQAELAAIGVPGMEALLGELMLYGDSMRQALAFLPRLSGRSQGLVSTDFRPYLEYRTPRGNALPYNTVPVNINFMQRLRPPGLPGELTIRNLPSENERNLILGYVASQRGDMGVALQALERVEGPARERAQEEMSRIESGAHHKAP